LLELRVDGRSAGFVNYRNNVYINNRYSNININRTVINRRVNVNNINRYNYVHKNVNYNNMLATIRVPTAASFRPADVWQQQRSPRQR